MEIEALLKRAWADIVASTYRPELEGLPLGEVAAVVTDEGHESLVRLDDLHVRLRQLGFRDPRHWLAPPSGGGASWCFFFEAGKPAHIELIEWKRFAGKGAA